MNGVGMFSHGYNLTEAAYQAPPTHVSPNATRTHQRKYLTIGVIRTFDSITVLLCLVTTN